MEHTMTPRIGMVGYYISEKDAVGGKIRGIPRQTFSMFSYDMIQSIFLAGGVPIPLPVITKDNIKKQLNHVDALIFSGGEDVDPTRYGSPASCATEVDPVRDQYEFDLLEEALQTDIPILCICRGMQLLNIYCGGTLHPEIREVFDQQSHWETDEPWKPVHSVTIQPEHFAAKLFGETEIQVNSIHHQAIKDLGKGIEAVGFANDQVIEIIGMKDRNHLLGVQWHPEMMAQHDENSLKPFHWLMNQTKHLHALKP